MRYRFNMLSRLAVLLLMDALLTFPVLLTINLQLSPAVPHLMYFAMLMSSYAFGFVVRMLFRRRNRLVTMIACLVMSVTSSILISTYTGDTIVMAVLMFAAACRSSAAAELRETGFAFPRVYFLSGMFIYFVGYALYGRLFAYREYQIYIFAAGLAATFSSLFMINSDVLAQASRAELRQSASMPSVKRNNRMLTSVLIFVAAFVSAFRLIKDYFLGVLRTAALFLIKIVEAIINFLYSPIDGGAPIEDGNPLPDLLPEDAGPGSPFWDAFWNIVIHIIAYIAIGFVVYMAVRYIVIALKKLYRLIAGMIRTFMDNSRYTGALMDYQDEKVSLIDWQSIRKGYSDGVKKLLRRILESEPKWTELKDNRQRVRYLYRHLLIKCIASGYKFNAGQTPGETIDQLSKNPDMDKNLLAALKRLYNKARYGTDPIDDAEMGDLGNAGTLIERRTR